MSTDAHQGAGIDARKTLLGVFDEAIDWKDRAIAAEAGSQRVRELHTESQCYETCTARHACDHCGFMSPCPTIRALDAIDG